MNIITDDDDGGTRAQQEGNINRYVLFRYYEFVLVDYSRGTTTSTTQELLLSCGG